jgi:hypothetical protein
MSSDNGAVSPLRLRAAILGADMMYLQHGCIWRQQQQQPAAAPAR